MKKLLVSLVMAVVGVIGMGRTASSAEERATLSCEKLDSSLGEVKPQDWNRYIN
jgi:hypothetical protein